MSSLLMSQVHLLRGLGGDEELDPEIQRQRAAQAAEMAKRGVGIVGQEAPEAPALKAQADVDQANVSKAAEVERRVTSAREVSGSVPATYDQRSTSISFGPMPTRGPRTSPLAVSWQSPFDFSQRPRAEVKSGVNMGLAMAGFGALFFGVALVLILKD